MSFRADRRHTGMTTQMQDTATLLESHRREIHVHCYRMTGSFEEAQDLTQEAFLRAWRHLEDPARPPVDAPRAWLYRIATNVCLDALAKRPRTPGPAGTAEITWLQPYPDELLESAPAPAADEPDAVVLAKETVELAYLVAVQHLPPRSRAVLILRDVLGWSAKDTADLLEMTVAAANSALQRSRTMLQERLPEGRLEWSPQADEQERELVRRYVEVSEAADSDGLLALIREDAEWSMPPDPLWIKGNRAMMDAWEQGGFNTPEFGDQKCVVTRANGQPAIAVYIRRPGEEAFTPMAMDVLRTTDGLVDEITTFVPGVFPWFGLPESL